MDEDTLVDAQPSALFSSLTRSWLRVVVEKPFGKDLASSEALANDICKHYPEEQVCLIHQNRSQPRQPTVSLCVASPSVVP